MRDRVKRIRRGVCMLKTCKKREFGRVELAGKNREEAGCVEDGCTDR